MNKLNDYQSHVLKIVSLGQGKWGWHQISLRASFSDGPDEAPMPALKKLQSLGLVTQYDLGNGNDKWEITESGKQLLEQWHEQDE